MGVIFHPVLQSWQRPVVLVPCLPHTAPVSGSLFLSLSEPQWTNLSNGFVSMFLHSTAVRSGQNARSAQAAPALAEESGCGQVRRTGSRLGGCSSQQARVFALLRSQTGLNEPTVLALPATAPPRPVSGRFVSGFSKHSSAAHRPWS